MTLRWILLLVLLSCTFPLLAEERPFEADIKVVLQVSDNDPALFQRVLTNTVNVIKAYGMDGVQVEIVAYAGGVWMLTDQAGLADRIQGLRLQYVQFSACGFTLSSIEQEQGKPPKLVDGVNVVPYGLPHIIDLEKKGYVYVRP